MVIEREPQQWMLRVTSQNLRNDAEAVTVRDDAGESYQSAIFSVQTCAVRKNPSREEVCDRAHKNESRLVRRAKSRSARRRFQSSTDRRRLSGSDCAWLLRSSDRTASRAM